MPRKSFYLDADGNPGRQIGGKDGGSEKGPGNKKGGGGKLLVGAAALVIATSGGGIAGSLGAADTAAGAGADSAASSAFESDTGAAALRELRTRVRRAKPSAQRGKRTKSWRRMRLRRTTRRKVANEVRCVALSYKQVRNFFLRHRCRSLHRELFALADPDGDTIVVSIIRVGMRSSHDARRLKDLIDVYGTGDILPLAGAVLGLGGIDFNGKHYASRRRARSLVIAETEPVSGAPSDAFLKGVAKIATWFPK